MDKSGSQNDAKRNTRATIPVPVVVPQTEWSLRWPRIPGDFFEDELIIRLRSIMGKVNSEKMPILFDAEIETVMFVGYDYREQPTFTGTDVGSLKRAVFVEVVMKFVEKHIKDEDDDGKSLVRGHNDFWKPGVGWQRLLRGDSVGSLNPVHKAVDMNGIFKLGHGQCIYRWVVDEWVVIPGSDTCVPGWACGAAPTDPGEDGDEESVECVRE